MATAAQSYFTVFAQHVKSCSRCGEPIYWLQSRKPGGKMYPVNVYVQNGQQVTSRTNFHKCDPAVVAAIEKKKLEAQGQQSFTNPPVPKMNMGGVNALFDKAIASGLKYPKIRLQTSSGQQVCLARAGNQSKYTGQVMVTDGEKFGYNKYFGRVDKTGVYQETPQSTDEIRTLLEQLGEDPATVAAKFGKLTGNCCFCMHSLDDERSTEVGYGPVCAKHFGLPWG